MRNFLLLNAYLLIVPFSLAVFQLSICQSSFFSIALVFIYALSLTVAKAKVPEGGVWSLRNKNGQQPKIIHSSRRNMIVLSFALCPSFLITATSMAEGWFLESSSNFVVWVMVSLAYAFTGAVLLCWVATLIGKFSSKDL